MDSATQETLGTLRRFPILYGIAWALFIAVIGTLTVSLLVHFGGLSFNRIVPAAYTMHCLAVLFGAIGATRCARERGWYYGGVTGLIYAVIMAVIGFVVYSTFSFDAGGLFRMLLMAVIGAFGGMIGVSTARD